MVERLWDPSPLMKDTHYDRCTDELIVLEQMLVPCLNQDGRANLRHLLDAHTKREAVAIRFAFKQGFYAAFHLVLEALSCPKNEPEGKADI